MNVNCNATNPPCAVNGQCGTTAQTCVQGTPSGYVAGSCGGIATWECQ